ncbi:MAG: NF038122 family metalloprotease [Bryobacterales bacterium]|nr:NF038122 family metalloprotease [Bryobacterales bacterium]
MPAPLPLAASPTAQANSGNGIVYTCDATITAASTTACETLNTTIAALYSSAFTNANATIYIKLGSTGLGHSNYRFNYETYSSFRSALITSEMGVNDTTALADSVPEVNPYGSDSVGLVNALQRALGFVPTSGYDASGGVCNQPGTAGCFDGIITISNAQPLYFRTGSILSYQYDFFTVAEHETDEILGTGSTCCGSSGSVYPADYFRYHSDGTRSYAYGTNDSCSASDSTNACFSLDGVHMLQQYNNLNNGNDTGDWIPNCSSQLVQDFELCPGVAGVDISPAAEILVLDVVGYTLAISQAPTVTTLAATSVTSSNATLNGTVNPNGATTNYWYSYGTDPTLADAVKTGTYVIVAGTTAAPAPAIVPGLTGGTTYYYRIQAMNSSWSSNGSILSFSTPSSSSAPPTVTTGAATSVTSSNATLNGTVNPNGAETSYTFSYATNSSLLDATQIGPNPIGYGNNAISVSAPISGLGANTIYYYRLQAANSAGTVFGVVNSFQTSTVLESVSTPSTPSGPTSGTPGTSYFYSTGGASDNLGNAVQYLLSWGDGTNSGWLPPGTTSASHSWPGGSYSVTAAARSMTNTSVVSLSSPPLSVDIASTAGALFVPITPCRVVDTRVSNGAFGSPSLAAGSTRDFIIPSGKCAIPTSALAYSLNVTVVPWGALNYLSVWPSGQAQPMVSTLNSVDGRIKANAAVIPAGNGGAVSVFATNTTDVLLDIDGYFVPASDTRALAFYPLPPCRVADTRFSSYGSLGQPSLSAGQPRTFDMLSSACNIPGNAQAYSLNFTAVPSGPLPYITTYPTGQPEPLASTLNAVTGTITANAAIVPAGNNGAVDVYSYSATDLLIDINGYFAPPGADGLSLYNLTPCRVLDTRQPTGSIPFSGELDVNVTASSCGASASAQAFVLNATVVPPVSLAYLTLWPQGGPQPLVSTLNALDGAITSNMAIVPTSNGSIAASPSNPTQLVLDIFGYFAP